jgi:hypothetical protein
LSPPELRARAQYGLSVAGARKCLGDQSR